MRPHTLVAVFIIPLLCGFTAQTPPPAPASTHIVSLAGTISSRKVWGPPGFGETPRQDKRFVVYTLKLKDAKTAEQLSLDEPPGQDSVNKKYSELQLRCYTSSFPQCEGLVSHSIGREVTVSGRVEFAVYPTDYLPITIEVLSIQAAQKSKNYDVRR